MIDVTEFSFTRPAGAGVVVAYNVFSGFRILGEVGHGACAVNFDDLSFSHFSETAGQQHLFLGGCRLELDPTSAVGNFDPPVGSLSLDPAGASLLIGSKYESTKAVRIVGKLPSEDSIGVAFTRWAVVRDRTGLPPEVLFEHDAAPPSKDD